MEKEYLAPWGHQIDYKNSVTKMKMATVFIYESALLVF